MKTGNNKSNQALETLPHAYGRYRILTDKSGNPVDYVFLEANAAFEEMTGLKREDIIGRKVTEVLPGIEKSEFDWIGVMGKVAQGGESLNLEQYSEPLERWYEVQAYSDEPGYFTTVFIEITARKRETASMKELVKLTENLLGADTADLNYQEIVETLQQLSGAKYTAINTYEEDRTKTVTRAIAGMPGLINKASEALGFTIAGQVWEIIPERLRKIEGGKLVRFSSLHETAMGSLSEITSSMLHKLAGIGDIYVIELAFGGQETLGDIIFFMPKNKEIENREAIELFAGQLASLLNRVKLEKKLRHNQRRLTQAQIFARSGMWEYDIKTEALFWSKECEALFGLEEGEFEGTFEAFKERVHPEDRQYVISMNQPITEYKEGVPLEYEHRIIKVDGTVLWVKEAAGVINDENGNPLSIAGFIADITERKQNEELLNIQNVILRTQQELSPDGILVVDANDRVISFNQKFSDIWGIPDEIMALQSGEKALSYVLPKLNDPEEFIRRINELYNNRQEKSHEEIGLKDGRVLDRYSAPMINNDGQYYGRVWFYRDVTKRKKAEEALRTSEMRSRALIEAVPDMLFRYNQDGIYLDALVNDEILLYGDALELYRNNALIGKSVTEVLPSPIGAKLMEGIAKALGDNKVIIQEYSYIVKDKDHYFEARLAPSGDKEVVSIVRDVTERIRYERELKYISLHDQLTGLYNRRYFENELERLNSSREHPIAVISADLDGLKLINDTLGHSEGDRYLQVGADLLNNALRASDILARVGGDEFALLLPRTGKEEAELLMNRIRRQVDSYNREQKNLPLSISLGLAVSESPDYSLEEVFRMADNNMYTEKLEQGKKARAVIVSSLLSSLFKRDNLAEGERAQVQELSIRLGLALQLEESRMADLELLAQVYDLGKVGLSDNLLHQSMLDNRGELTEAEREAICRHPETGYRIALASPDLAGVAELVLRHHENYDGTGYPLGIKGEKIPVECRILAIAIA